MTWIFSVPSFHANQLRNTETADTKSFTPSIKVSDCAEVQETDASFDNTGFHKKPKKLTPHSTTPDFTKNQRNWRLIRQHWISQKTKETDAWFDNTGFHKKPKKLAPYSTTPDFTKNQRNWRLIRQHRISQKTKETDAWFDKHRISQKTKEIDASFDNIGFHKKPKKLTPDSTTPDFTKNQRNWRLIRQHRISQKTKETDASFDNIGFHKKKTKETDGWFDNTGFHKNSTRLWTADIRSQTDVQTNGLTWSPHTFSFRSLYNAQSCDKSMPYSLTNTSASH